MQTYMNDRIIHKDITGSTNADAAALAAELSHGAVIWADAQTAGRGRRGRSWLSEAEGNLYFSLLLKPDFEPERASMLTLVMALAVAQGIQAILDAKQSDSAPQVQIKWPNDIIINGRKVCGILTEMQAVPGKIQHVIIGVGVNVDQMHFSEELTHASSLRRESGIKQDREDLLKRILCAFDKLYEEFCEAGTLAPMLSDYQSRLVNLNKEVKVLDPKGAYQGVTLGMNEKGELLVLKVDGTTEAVYAGEVSVRGLYGYV